MNTNSDNFSKEEEKTLSPKELFKRRMGDRWKISQRLQTIREEKEPTSRKELREIATKLGIKGAWRFNSKTLCEKLTVPLVKNEVFDKHHRDVINTPVKIYFTADDGEKMEFHSIYKAAKTLGKNPSCIPFCIKNEKGVVFKGKNWTVSR